MKILLTGATGYIGKRILPALIQEGHHVICCVRDKKRFYLQPFMEGHVEVIEVDFLNENSLSNISNDIDGAYYLIHSMASSSHFSSLEIKTARNFRKYINSTQAKHVIYLSGIVNENKLSKHLESRKAVENELSKGNYNFTVLRAGIIIGSGSASFEIIRDLVEKLPIMVAPKWVHTRCQPIAIRDVIQFLILTLFNPVTYNQDFDIGGPDVLNYKEMLIGYARSRNLKRKIWVVPVLTPKLSSYWLFFVTSTTYQLAVSLVESMKVHVVCRDKKLEKILKIQPLDYSSALQKAFSKIEQQEIISSWKDSMISGRLSQNLSEFIRVPQYGCFKDTRESAIENKNDCLNKIWKIGGKKGWYYANWLWKIRGILDKLSGGVGLRRGRTHPEQIHPGDSIDFWRVLYAKKEEGRLLLYAEMKVPGEAWLEFQVKNNRLIQTATFRPKGLWGRIYWYMVYPFHGLIFGGMIRKLAK
ncbi:SDR family oxidoreductase [Echinicola jeungdonensis]|uniref:SDR family oxidoreductase n=1 Tax=Echinicola jeungdonensis TaxID=709343 RepID=A0ABV5J5Q7_9BACT|nr:SDR family oxidoreductase [Echinicola jeungdonensis]MDN3670984.1 SDR family oxidoreductase [Echinicola jeungdonensis]